MIKQIGVIGVDAGLCWIGDPCYILHTNEPPEDIGKNWQDFCDRLFEKNNFIRHKQMKYDGGHDGLGVIVETGYGDGVYPVFAKFNTEGRVIKVWVEFA